MKKLILYDHLGNKTLELETFVEGQDFQWQAPTTQPYWLGKILLVDKEPELESDVKVPEEVAKDIAEYEAREAASKDEVKPEPKHLTEIPPELEELEQGLNKEGLTLKTLEVKSREDMSEEVKAIKRECSECGWTGTQGECSFGHHDFYCPNCGKEALKEVTNEPETTGDKSPRKRRASKTDAPKDSKKLPKKPARGQASKRSK